MINEIYVRTNKADYSPGEDICGAVYLHIINPTAGRGVRVSFHGYEQVEYEYKNEGREDQFVGYREMKYYINQQVSLHESQGPLNIGNTVYPFKIHLPVEIPGTFKAKGENDDVRWRAIVEYVLEVQVIDASQMNISTVITIKQSLPRGIVHGDCPKAVSAEFTQTKLLLFTDRISTVASFKGDLGRMFYKKAKRCKIRLHILYSRIMIYTVHKRLQSHVHRTGENMQLRVIITNNSSISVQSLKIQLFRKLILMFRRRRLSESLRDENVSGTDDRVFVCPEESSCVYQIQHIDMTNYQKGLDNIQIPLRHTDGTCMTPAVRGLFVKCEYSIKLVVTLSNTYTYDLLIPVTVIQAERDRGWSTWTPPDWLLHEDFKVVHSDSIFGVTDSFLNTESFAKIPGFQPL